MSNRIYRIDKVENIMGLKEHKIYDKIDIFIDRTNQNNQWAILHSTEFIKGRLTDKQEIIRFINNDAMLNFLRSNFDCYELNHEVNFSQKHIFFHFIDYCNVNYMLHEGKPHLNYIELNYREYADGTFYRKSINLPKEYEKMFDEIIRISKKIPTNIRDVGRLHLTTDVYSDRKEAIRARVNKYTIPMEEYLYRAGSKIRNIKNTRNIRISSKFVKRFKLVAVSTLVATILGTGYHLMTKNIYNSEFLDQRNPIKSMRDVSIYFNKDDNGIIIDKLMEQKYDEVGTDNLDKLFSFLKDIDSSNYDNNGSFNAFDYDDYFDYKLLEKDNYFEMRVLLEKIENLYRRSFVYGDNVTINTENAKEYIDFVSSLTFMYDTYHGLRKSNNISINNQSIISKTASTEEISTYDSFPPILRFLIMNQLKGLMSHTDYRVTNKPTYYFKSTEKSDLLNEIDERITNIKNDIYSKCGYNYFGKNR